MPPIAPQPANATLAEQRAYFAEHGFVVLPDVIDQTMRAQLCEHIMQNMDPLVGPAEFEADVGYPGAPENRHAPGGKTPRRLLHAYARSDELKSLATQPRVLQVLRGLMGDSVCLSQCHHNCVMTKHPGFSSATLWHQDVRYWSFERPELISVWFALGEENQANGALQVIPGTHRLDIDTQRLDADLFLRPELEENGPLIERAEVVELNPGDVLLFHCRLFHAAGRNTSDAVKLSAVFTYHRKDNRPQQATRSDRFPSIDVVGAHAG